MAEKTVKAKQPEKREDRAPAERNCKPARKAEAGSQGCGTGNGR